MFLENEDVHQRRRHPRRLDPGRHVLQTAHGRLRAQCLLNSQTKCDTGYVRDTLESCPSHYVRIATIVAGRERIFSVIVLTVTINVIAPFISRVEYPSRYFCKAAKVGAQGEGDFRRPVLIRDCSGNVGFQVVSRPSPGDDNGPSRAGALIKLNFSFGSSTDLQRPLKYRRFSTRNETFGAECRQSAGKRT